MDPLWRPSGPVSPPPSPAAYLLGWVDTNVPGHRWLRAGATLYEVPPGYYRGDEIAAELTTQGLTTNYDAGLFDVRPLPSATLTADDRLGVVMGLFARAGETLPSKASHVSQRISPVAIPLVGAHWRAVTTDADDVLTVSRTQRAAGYVWGSARLWDIELWMSRQSWQAFEFGWCARGKVTVTPSLGLTQPMSGPQPAGFIEGQVLSVQRAEWTSSAEVLARVQMRIASEP